MSGKSAAKASLSLVFDQDHGDALHEKLAKTIRRADEVFIVVGFLTRRGLDLLEESIKPNPKAVKLIAVGHGGLEALQALARLRNNYGIPEDNLRIDRGAIRHAFGRSYVYQPMLHSKIYYVERPKGESTAYIGSHNLTHYAVSGLNCEAGVRITGSREKPEFVKIRNHIDQIARKTVKFEPSMIDRYVWLHNKYLDTLRDGRATNSTSPIMVIAAEPSGGLLPSPSDTIYFEVPRGDQDFQKFREVGYPVNIHLVPKVSSIRSLRALSSVRGPVVVSTIHLSNQTGKDRTEGRVVSGTQMDWIIDDLGNPILRKVAGGSIAPGQKALQVQVIVEDVGERSYDYSPPEGYSYRALPSQRRVLNEDAITAMRSDEILGGRLAEMTEELFGFQEIESIERTDQIGIDETKEWKGTKRLRLRDGDRELPMWHTKYNRLAD